MPETRPQLPEQGRLAERRALRALGARIRDKRDEKDMDGKEVAAAAGLPPSTVSKIENGRQNATFLTLARIAQALGCQLADLMPRELPAGLIPPGDPGQG